MSRTAGSSNKRLYIAPVIVGPCAASAGTVALTIALVCSLNWFDMMISVLGVFVEERFMPLKIHLQYMFYG